jgi:hypothetical protein
MTSKQVESCSLAIDYFEAISKKGTFSKEDLPTLYGDGSRWGVLTLKGFIACYKSWKEAKDNVSQALHDEICPDDPILK